MKRYTSWQRLVAVVGVALLVAVMGNMSPWLASPVCASGIVNRHGCRAARLGSARQRAPVGADPMRHASWPQSHVGPVCYRDGPDVVHRDGQGERSARQMARKWLEIDNVTFGHSATCHL
jgi:hypothetical protein